MRSTPPPGRCSANQRERDELKGRHKILRKDAYITRVLREPHIGGKIRPRVPFLNMRTDHAWIRAICVKVNLDASFRRMRYS